MSKILIYTYNNYFNRIIKRENTIGGYNTAGNLIYNNGDNVTNFNPNDGLTTELIIGNDYNGTGDYLLVVENDYLEAFAPVSRWFITEHQRTRQGQYRLILRRDIIADYYNYVITAPMIVSRAMISNVDNPLLFNSEGFSYNQIKKREYLLSDDLEARWYYLYFKKAYVSQSNISVVVDQSSYDQEIPGKAADFFPSNDVTLNNISLNYFNIRSLTGYDNGWAVNPEKWAWRWTGSAPQSVNCTKITDTAVTRPWIYFNNTFVNIESTIKGLLGNWYTSTKNTYFTEKAFVNDVTDQEYEAWRQYDQKVVKDSEDKLYYVTVTTTSQTEDEMIDSNNCPTTYNYFNNLWNTSGVDISSSGQRTEYFSASVLRRTIRVNYTPYEAGTITFKLFEAPKTQTEDSDFNIIAIPYESINVKDDTSGSTIDFTTSTSVSQKIVRAISLAAGDNLVDIQLLPYCPYQTSIKTVGSAHLSLGDTLDSNQYQYLFHSSANDNVILYLRTCNFTFNISMGNTPGVTTLTQYDNDPAINKKICNEVELWRLVSPNFDGMFEYSNAKNNGVDYFNVDVTARPFNPYLHINPNFKSLYGQDWDSPVGLVCNGDFSLPRETSAWTNYELQNKNYQIAFNRQIEHLDFQQNQERIQSTVGMIAGTLGGAAVGGLAGSRLGLGVGGAIAGAAVGGVVSLAGGITDLTLMNSRQAEDKSFAIDNFKYQLGNIKAMPNSISKVSPITFNNKKFPVLEYYTCTDEEIGILKNKLMFNSMNVNAIGTIQDYQQVERTFISGDLLRFDNSNPRLSSNEIYEIYKEIKQGVYI